MIIINNTSASSTSDESFPIGGIALWYGVAHDVPAGWRLCDGNYSPNILGRFVMGASDDSNLLETGGATTHVHSGDKPSAVLTTNHTHTVASSSIGNSGKTNYINSGTSTHAAMVHTHTASSWEVTAGETTREEDTTTTNHTHSQSGISGSGANLPVYKRLYYIMRSS